MLENDSHRPREEGIRHGSADVSAAKGALNKTQQKKGKANYYMILILNNHMYLMLMLISILNIIYMIVHDIEFKSSAPSEGGFAIFLLRETVCVCVCQTLSLRAFHVFKAGLYGSSCPPYAMKLRYDEGGVD